MKSRKSLFSGIVIAASLLIASAPAIAEGSFTSYWSNVGVNTHTRTWTDTQADSNDTKITHASCNRTSVTYQLTRERPFPLPDVNEGSRTASCSGTATNRTGNWGNVSNSGNFHLTITAISGGTTVTANSLTISY